jgi:RND family efflux transporter MFP subunit
MRRRWMFLVWLTSTVLFYQCSQRGGSSEEQNAIPVEVVKIGLGEVKQSLTFHGDIRAEVEVKVFAKIPDRIEAFFVDDGDRIQKGDPIAKVLATTIEQAVLQAEAGLTAAKAQEANMKVEYERAKRLNRENAMSTQQFDAIETQYEAASAQVTQAEAALNTTRTQLRDATVTAPISGIIGKRYYEVGDMASPTMPVVSIVQMNRVRIVVNATEEDLGRLAVGQKAEVQVRSYPDEVFVGQVQKISPILDPTTRLAEVDVIIANPEQKLKPGMYAEAEITTGILKDVLVVPRYSVIESTSMESVNGDERVVKNYFIFVVNDSSRAEQRLLDVDYVNYKQIAVRSGIELGERLVVSGQNNLRDGLPVDIVQGGEVE